ncbi:MAG: hypothetical protein LBV80_00125 [Deltaproteobacteria bacterium]|nr:hypothetical protein [Deltaproteobacteria bacterium]
MAKRKQKKPSCKISASLVSSHESWQTISEGCQIFSFPKEWIVEKYDAWRFVKYDVGDEHLGFNGIKEKGIKSVDFCAIDTDSCLWLIEVKDFRKGRKDNDIGIFNNIVDKILYSMSGLFAARYTAERETEKKFAQQAATTQKMRFVLQIEVQTTTDFDSYFIDIADIQHKMEQKLSRIAPNPIVASMNNLQGLPWNVCDVTNKPRRKLR